MSGILLAGLTDQEAAAIEILIGMHWRGQHVVTIARSTNLSVPAQDSLAQACGSCVVDLFGLGMRRHSPDNQARLLRFLNGRSAVLLIWGSGGGWLESQWSADGASRLAWVNLHYTSAQMLDALRRIGVDEPPRAVQRISEHQAPTAATAPVAEHPAPAPHPSAELPAWRRALALAEHIKAGRSVSAVKAFTLPQPATEPDIPDAPTTMPAPRSAGLRPDNLLLILAAIPQARQLPLMGLIRRITATDGPQLLRAGEGMSFVIDTQQGWLASCVSVETLVQQLRTPAIHESLVVTPIAPHDLKDTLHGLSLERRDHAHGALDILIWELLSDALSDVALQARGDVCIRLRRFPNFTQLSRVGRLDIQLAAICARTSQSLTDLVRAFPGNTQDVYRFALLSSVCGAAAVQSSAMAATAGSHGAKAAIPASQTTAQRGFFKSLLDKLF